MDLSIWLPAMLTLGLLVIAALFGFVYFCDRV